MKYISVRQGTVICGLSEQIGHPQETTFPDKVVGYVQWYGPYTEIPRINYEKITFSHGCSSEDIHIHMDEES
jgi:hypothetical protein